jgi:hypothetical protein
MMTAGFAEGISAFVAGYAGSFESLFGCNLSVLYLKVLRMRHLDATVAAIAEFGFVALEAIIFAFLHSLVTVKCRHEISFKVRGRLVKFA